MNELLPCTGPASCQRREIAVSATPEEARAALDAAIRETHGIVIGRAGAPVATDGGGLHAEYRVAFGLFVDDVDAPIAPRGAQTVVTLRSASRVGRGDFGVNALRMRALAAALSERLG